MRIGIISGLRERIHRSELYGQVVYETEAAVIVPHLLDLLHNASERELAVELNRNRQLDVSVAAGGAPATESSNALTSSSVSA